MNGPFPILMYHKIGPRPSGALVPHHYVSTSRFRNQVRALTRFGFRTSKLADLYSQSASLDKPIVLSFDDGYCNFLTEAVPVLEANGQTGTVFVVSGLLGKENQWDTRNGDHPEPLLTVEQVKEVSSKGFEVGSHSVSHARLTEVDHNTLVSELVESKAFLETVLGHDVKAFCYPYGAENDVVRDAVSNAGYHCACTVRKGWNTSATDRYCLRRVNVRSDTSTPILFWKLWRQARSSQG